VRVALIQLTSSDDPSDNLPVTLNYLREAASAGAEFLLTPEVTNCVSVSRSRQQDVLSTEAQDLTLSSVREAANALGVHLLIGSLALRQESGDRRFVNRSFLIGPDGEIAARYDKIHMFDVTVTASETYRESDGYRPGDRAVLTNVDGVHVGMTICYDVRFPQLYRTLAQAGAEILTVPSAFSPVTGEAHWETLLRARAVETGAFVLAPAQTGQHRAAKGRVRSTYGHSLVVSPWGEVLADGGDLPGVTLIDLRLDDVKDCRRRVPSLAHDQNFTGPD
jgi:predicted amidohydrolase